MATLAHPANNDVFVRDNMVCKLDTVTYVSPEHGEMETVVEVCEPYVPCAEKAACASEERMPEEQVFTSPEFGGEIEASI
ncbi:hypothetical protein [uncultured Bilophila sp.]|uniref:hypothetical protein n=2 Tax=uncultured Bilophila sp. TaxID=529385 RepID=UPI0025EACF41|nr:hypothetical protein [uncultured Bilophila sp.]